MWKLASDPHLQKPSYAYPGEQNSVSHLDSEKFEQRFMDASTGSSSDSSDSTNAMNPGHNLFVIARSIPAQPRGGDSQVRQWVTDLFWFEDPEFQHNLSVSHLTFLWIVSIVKESVRDSMNPLTG